MDALRSGRGESIKPGDPRLARNEVRFIATPQIALEAAAAVAREASVPVHVLGDSIEGEALDVGKTMAGIALQVAHRGSAVRAALHSSVRRRNNRDRTRQGCGGRNVEFLLSLAVALDGCDGIHAMAGDTDGVDGLEEIAGAYLAPDTLVRAWRQGTNPSEAWQTTTGTASSSRSAIRS
jgi:hydroxypyruvate reductase